MDADLDMCMYVIETYTHIYIYTHMSTNTYTNNYRAPFELGSRDEAELESELRKERGPELCLSLDDACGGAKKVGGTISVGRRAPQVDSTHLLTLYLHVCMGFLYVGRNSFLRPKAEVEA